MLRQIEREEICDRNPLTGDEELSVPGQRCECHPRGWRAGLQGSEGGNHLGRFECAIAPTDGDLPEDVCIDEPSDGFSRMLEGPSDEPGGAVHGKDRGAGETPEEKVCRRLGADGRATNARP